jgi:hypothetical protein
MGENDFPRNREAVSTSLLMERRNREMQAKTGKAFAPGTSRRRGGDRGVVRVRARCR